MLSGPILIPIPVFPNQPAPDYSAQLQVIAKAVSSHEAVPSWLLGTLLGFVLGLLAEPGKNWIQKFLLRRRIERLLIAEVEMSCFMAHVFTTATKLPTISFTIDKYEYFHEKERLTVFEIDKAGSLSRLYRSFKDIAEAPSEERKTKILYEFSLFEDAVKQGVLGPYFKRAFDKDGSPLRTIAAKYVPPA